VGDLASAGSRVLLVATARHDPGSVLPDLPPVVPTAQDLAETLTGRCGVADDHLHRLIDPENPIVLANAIKDVAGLAGDVFVLWYAGHGQLGTDNELYLATRATVDVKEDGGSSSPPRPATRAPSLARASATPRSPAPCSTCSTGETCTAVRC
jgi:hypothetical protein